MELDSNDSDKEEIVTLKKQWMKPWIKYMKNRGSFSFLENKLLLNNEDSYNIYLRMTKDRFKYLLNLINKGNTRADTVMRNYITPAEKLT